MSRRFGYARQILTEQSLWSLPIKTFKSQAESLLALAKMTEADSVNPLVRNTALRIIDECTSREDDCELQALYSTVRDGNAEIAPFINGFKYVADPRYADYFTAPSDSITNCLKKACGGDCLPGETLVLAAGYKFKAIADVRAGDVIMGDGQWVRVTNWWDKGRQEILEFGLNNGSTLRCTPDHRVFVVPAFAPRSGAIELAAREVRLEDRLLVIESGQDVPASIRPSFERVDVAATVTSITAGASADTFDIEVEGHRFYLPESDLVVHNCDDHTALMCALCGSTGWKVGLRAWGPKDADGFSHVYAVVAYPKRPSSKGFERVMGMDTTVAEAYPGWEPPAGNVLTAWLT